MGPRLIETVRQKMIWKFHKCAFKKHSKNEDIKYAVILGTIHRAVYNHVKQGVKEKSTDDVDIDDV